MSRLDAAPTVSVPAPATERGGAPLALPERAPWALPQQGCCRACGERLALTMCDLGLTPVSNAFVRPDSPFAPEVFYPLQVHVCTRCWLAQLASGPSAEVHFHGDYVYFSSYSDTWLEHCRRHVESSIQRWKLGAGSRVVELASNDGYLLQYFVQRGIPCLGVDPASNTAVAARRKGVETREAFFGCAVAGVLAAEGWQADLLIGNNVLAHVPDLHDFVGGMATLLRPEGVITLEFPHLLRLLQGGQFDTVYHEHYSYLSLIALLPVFERAGLRVFDVEALPTHGGSLRLFVCHQAAHHARTAAVSDLVKREVDGGLLQADTYRQFAARVQRCKRRLLHFLIEARERGERIAAYGAAAKGNTLLNFCGIGIDMVECVADRNEAKHGRLLPGTRIPVVTPADLLERRPDYVLILPWNIRAEIMHQLDAVRSWGGRFVTAIPELEILP